MIGNLRHQIRRGGRGRFGGNRGLGLMVRDLSYQAGGRGCGGSRFRGDGGLRLMVGDLGDKAFCGCGGSLRLAITDLSYHAWGSEDLLGDKKGGDGEKN